MKQVVKDWLEKLEHRRESRFRAYVEEWPDSDPADPTYTDPNVYPELAEGPEPWTITAIDPETGLITLVETRRLFDLWLEQSGEDLEHFLGMPQAIYARLSGRYPWLEDVYAAAGV